MGKKLLDKIKVTPLKIIKLSAGDIMSVLNKNELKNHKTLRYYVFCVFSVSLYIPIRDQLPPLSPSDFELLPNATVECQNCRTFIVEVN